MPLFITALTPMIMTKAYILRVAKTFLHLALIRDLLLMG